MCHSLLQIKCLSQLSTQHFHIHTVIPTLQLSTLICCTLLSDRIPNYRMSESSLLGFSGCHCSISVLSITRTNVIYKRYPPMFPFSVPPLNDDTLTHIHKHIHVNFPTCAYISFDFYFDSRPLLICTAHTNFIQFDWTWIKDIRFIIMKLFVSPFSIQINQPSEKQMNKFVGKRMNSQSLFSIILFTFRRLYKSFEIFS